MIRFSLRARNKAAARAVPADRPQSPPGAKPAFATRASSPAASAPGSFLVNYDALPTRRPDGLALDYVSYKPSRFYVPPARPRRRSRPAAPNDHVNTTPNLVHSARPALDLGLDLDSLQRNKTRPPDLLHFVPVERRVRAKINELRRLLAKAEQLGDIEVLKDLVGIHEANLANQKHAVQTARSQIKEAKIIAGITEHPNLVDLAAEPRVTIESRSTLIRKVSGRPIRHFSGRTVSALKARTASMRSSSRHQKSTADAQNEPAKGQRGVQPPGPMKGKSDATGNIPHKVARKSSARLKRLGSAGGVLMRRLSKVSIAEDVSTGSSGEAPISSTFDQDTMKRLKACPDEVLSKYDADLKQVQATEEAEADKLREARNRLEERRSIHDSAMTILDQFYGSMPGWEDDPVAKSMLPETAELTEAGLEAERDLAEMRSFREHANAAYDDTSRGLMALRIISSTMSRFIEDLERLLGSVGDEEERLRVNTSLVNISGDRLKAFLRDLGMLLKKCVQNAATAAICCVDAPRVDQVERDLGKLAQGFGQEAGAVVKQGNVVKNDFAPTLQVAKAGLCDCKLAETFIGERYNMISEDLDTMDGQVERYEEYVMMERIGLLDMHHPVRESH